MTNNVFFVDGNLLESDCDVIIQQCNCFATQGAGLAKQIVKLYPSVLEADRAMDIPVGSKKRLGRTSHVWVDGPEGRLLVVNLYGQFRYGNGIQTQYEAVRRGLRSIFARIVKLQDKKGDVLKVGLPMGMGAGFAGGDWSKIHSIISEEATKSGIDVYCYKLR